MSASVRSLRASDLPALSALVAADPIGQCFVAGRIEEAGLDIARLGGEVWGYPADGPVTSALFVGANVIPIATDAPARAGFADRLRRTGRRGSSIVGRSTEVLDLWRLLEPSWGPARDVRSRQPLLAIEGPPAGLPDPLVRPVRPDELDLLLPACIAMFTEEVGVSPVAGGAHGPYRARIAELIREGRALARIEDGVVVFKAEIGALSSACCQVQGVWVDPAHRGRGLAAPGMAAVVEWARHHQAPVVSLYVNDFNTAARRAYERVGFVDAGEFATVLFP